MSDLPIRIFLQHDPEDTGEPFKEAHEVTWCKDQINDMDCEYIRADVAKRAAEILRDLADGIRIVNTVGQKWVLQEESDHLAKAEHDELLAIAEQLSPSGD